MMRFILFLGFSGLFSLAISAQEINPEARATIQSLTPAEAHLQQLSHDYVHFETRLRLLKEAFAARETAKVIAYHQLLLDSMREKINKTMEAGEAQKLLLKSMNEIVAGLEGHSFEFDKPQEASTAFGKLEKFQAIMQDALILELEKSSNGVHKQ